MSGKVYNEVISDKSLVIIAALLIGLSWLMLLTFGILKLGEQNITFASLLPILAAILLWGAVIIARKFRNG